MSEIVYVDDVPPGTGTPLDAAHMNALQQKSMKGVANGYASLDSLANLALTAAQQIVFGGNTNLYRHASGVLASDYTFYASIGVSQVGIGAAGPAGQAGAAFGNASDTNLYRQAAGLLRTSGDLGVNNSIYADMNGAGSKLYFGSAQDVNLYRESPSVLKTDGHLVAGLQVQSYRNGAGQIALTTSDASASGAPMIRFGTANDTNLYRQSAGSLKTDGSLYAAQVVSAGRVSANIGVAAQIDLYSDGKIYFSPASDTNLYRVAAGVLRTDGALFTGGVISPVDDTGNSFKGIAFGSAQDVRLYRSAAQTLRTDGSFRVNQFLDVDFQGIGASIRFGSALDTTLYRLGVNQLKTDGWFETGGDLLVRGSYRLQASRVFAGAVAGAQTTKFKLFDESGNLLGYIPLYPS